MNDHSTVNGKATARDSKGQTHVLEDAMGNSITMRDREGSSSSNIAQ